jgi:hypothetical protein
MGLVFCKFEFFHLFCSFFQFHRRHRTLAHLVCNIITIHDAVPHCCCHCPASLVARILAIHIAGVIVIVVLGAFGFSLYNAAAVVLAAHP